MTVYVYRNGKLIEKIHNDPVIAYRFKEYESPITGALITSSRQRERDLNRADAFDPRDTPADFRRAKERREETNAGYAGQQSTDFWRD